MAKTVDDLIPSAEDVMKKIALAEAEKAAEAFRKHAQAEAERKAEMARLAGPSGLSEDEKIELAAKVIRRAIVAARKCWSIAFPTSCAPITAAPSTSRSRAGKTP